MRSSSLRSLVSLAACVVLAILLYPAIARAQDLRPDDHPAHIGPPTITVSGHGEAEAAPDRAVVQLGAVAQAKHAADAQAQVNEVMQQAIARVQDLGVPAEQISTRQIELTPVYSEPRPAPGDGNDRVPGTPPGPRIVSYRATNTIQIELRDLKRLGDVIDAAVAAGANQVQNISFQLHDDSQPRQQALRRAVQDARDKAHAIADAMNQKLGNVQHISESGVHVVSPGIQSFGRMMAAAAGQPTPVQPGQIHVQADVVLEYRLSAEPAAPPPAHPNE